jgi:hypothetical protein
MLKRRRDEMKTDRLGEYVRINAGMNEFVGSTGTIVGVEGIKPKMYRVRLDEPVSIPSVGLVKDDLWEGSHLKRVTKPNGEAAPEPSKRPESEDQTVQLLAKSAAAADAELDAMKAESNDVLPYTTADVDQYIAKRLNAKPAKPATARGPRSYAGSFAETIDLALLQGGSLNAIAEKLGQTSGRIRAHAKFRVKSGKYTYTEIEDQVKMERVA